jgi:LL-diaminopimelate aminotransferase
VRQFRERRDVTVAALNAQGFEVATPRATMYLWIPLPDGVKSADFRRRALEDAGVVTLAGSDFGAAAEGFFRVALTVGSARLQEAAERLGRVLATV